MEVLLPHTTELFGVAFQKLLKAESYQEDKYKRNIPHFCLALTIQYLQVFLLCSS